MMTSRESDWRTVIGSIAGEAAAEIDDLPPEVASGFDGDAYTWTWTADSAFDDQVVEVVLRGYPDSLETGIQTEVVGVARKKQEPLLSWSAVTGAMLLVMDEDEPDSISNGSIKRFQEFLPQHLMEALHRARNIAPELETLERRRQDRYQMFKQEHRGLFPT